MKVVIEIENSENKPHEIQNIIKYLEKLDNIVYSPCGIVGNVDRRCYTISPNDNKKDIKLTNYNNDNIIKNY